MPDFNFWIIFPIDTACYPPPCTCLIFYFGSSSVHLQDPSVVFFVYMSYLVSTTCCSSTYLISVLHVSVCNHSLNQCLASSCVIRSHVMFFRHRMRTRQRDPWDQSLGFPSLRFYVQLFTFRLLLPLLMPVYSVLVSGVLLRLLDWVLVKAGGSFPAISAAENLCPMADHSNVHLVHAEAQNQVSFHTAAAYFFP